LRRPERKEDNVNHISPRRLFALAVDIETLLMEEGFQPSRAAVVK